MNKLVLVSATVNVGVFGVAELATILPPTKGFLVTPSRTLPVTVPLAVVVISKRAPRLASAVKCAVLLRST